MALTPLDIRKTEFTRRLRGLDPDEVGAYLELVAREVEVAQQDVRMRDERIHDLEGRLQHYERIELALEEALRTTRESSRQVMEAAHQKAERLQAEAEEEATRIQSRAQAENRRLRQEAQAIAVRRKEVVARLRAFLMSEMEVLAHFDGEDPVGFIKLMPNADSLLGVGGEHDLAAAPAPRPTSAPADVAGAPDVAAASVPAPPPAPPLATPPPATPPPAAPAPFMDEAPAPESQQRPWATAPHTSSAPDLPAFSFESADVVFDSPTPSVAAWEVPAPQEGYPTPVPEPVAARPEALPPEFEAYFQNLPFGAAPAPADDPSPEAPAGIYFPLDPPTDEPVAPHLHAPEPGEPPVPEPVSESWASPEATMGWPEPAYDPAPPASPAPYESVHSLEMEAAPGTPLDAPEEPAPHAAPFDVRAVRRERYRIETFVGPSVPPVNAAEADQSEESAHLRRLLDGLA